MADMENEVWKEVGEGWYLVSDLGSMKSNHKKGRGGGKRDVPVSLEPYTDDKGYLNVGLRIGAQTFHKLVHDLVLEAFVGPCPEGMEARHLDGDPGNNDLDNLCWGTPLENTADSIQHGTHTKAIMPSEDLIREIKRRHDNGEVTKSIAKKVGHSFYFVQRIIDDEHWLQR